MTQTKHYLDNACTSHPKPAVVWEAVKNYQVNIGASPARSGHTLGKKADGVVSETRQLLADLFNAKDPRHIVFTQNSTQALNMIIKGTLTEGDHVITTNLEHNSTLRPLENLSRAGMITYTVVQSDNQGIIDPKAIEKAIEKKTKLIAVNHASNAIGVRTPINAIGKVAKANNLLFLIDASQTAGVLEIDIEKDHIDFVAFTGHKSLYGPSGIGGAFIRDPKTVRSFIEGGSGNSKSLVQPAYLPEKFEAGTHNYMGIAGLNASLKTLLKKREEILKKELELTEYLIQRLDSIEEITVYGTKKISLKVPVVSFNMKGFFANQLAGILDEEYDILTRPGLHCAPLVHKRIGTAPTGTVRVSLGMYNTKKQIDHLIKSLEKIAAGKKTK